jgi:ribosomal protein S18 acetylase RimI-like enzyme
VTEPRPASPTPEVRQATPADLDALVRVLVAGFGDDPLYRWFTAEDRFEEVMALMFRADIEGSYLPGGECYIAEDGSGASIWRPSPGPASRRSRLHLLREIGGLARISGWQRLPRFLQLIARTEAEHPSEPHWYLSLLAVDPSRQRTGVGSRLLSHVLERVDADHLPAYLENSKARNLEFYERHGFRTFKRLEFGRGGPYLWLMWREAR